MVIQFRVYGIPQTKGSTKAFFRPGMRYPVITNDNPRNKNWSLCVSEVAAHHRPAQLLTGPIHLSLIFYMPKPKSLPKRRPSYPTKKPDISKLTRSAEDALTGIIYHDDAQIVESQQRKEYSDSPGVEIIVTPIDQEGASVQCPTRKP